MADRTWKLTIDDDELKTLIRWHSEMLLISGHYNIERSARIHFLTRRLNKEDAPEIEKEKEQPPITDEQAKSHLPSGW